MSRGANVWKGNQEGKQEIEWVNGEMGNWGWVDSKETREVVLKQNIKRREDIVATHELKVRNKGGNIREYKRSTRSVIQRWLMSQEWYRLTWDQLNNYPFTHHHMYNAGDLTWICNYNDPQDLKIYEPYNRVVDNTTLQSSYGARQPRGRSDRCSLSTVGQGKGVRFPWYSLYWGAGERGPSTRFGELWRHIGVRKSLDGVVGSWEHGRGVCSGIWEN